MNNYCVIMAGGVGSRFWPLSTSDCPKQFLDPLGLGKSFLRLTFERFLPIVPKENFLIVTSENYLQKVMEHIPELDKSQILLEPMRRNTAPCIAYASWRIYKDNPNARIVVTPSDHLVLQEEKFRSLISEGFSFVDNSNKLLTIGITPTRPETGYGYIHFDKTNIQKVKAFTEKPDLDLAKKFIESGEFLWNSGIFIWSVKGIKNAINEFTPELGSAFDNIAAHLKTTYEQQYIDEIYPLLKNISIDYAIMEKSPNVYVFAGDFGWSDIGTWGSIKQHMPADNNGNVLSGQVLCYNSSNSLIMIEKGKVAIIEGVADMLIVNEKNRLLICKLKNEQSLRSWLEELKHQYSED